ncbi:MAG: glycosyl hydrolase family 28-related protein [Chitinophagaceae bacterium]
MHTKPHCIFLILLFNTCVCIAQHKYGATLPWITYEAEQMHTNGQVLSPNYLPHFVETESSGQQAVRLNTQDNFIEFASASKANSMVIRYSMPDSKDGGGLNSVLDVYVNGKIARHCNTTSRYTWLYGKYPFVNEPSAGKPRHFYDEIRIKDLRIEKGNIIRIQRRIEPGDTSSYCIIDLVDLENIAAPLQAPANSLSVKMFVNSNPTNDYTEAFQKCIAEAAVTGKTVWIPEGQFKITGNVTIPGNVTIQGAGMWYSELVGDALLYTNANKRVRFIGKGSNIHLSDFSITGELTYRSDREDNDGIVGSFGDSSTISRIWIDHTKVGMWIENSTNLQVTGCRLRNTIADGINFCVGMAYSTISNCTARGTGDDGFAIWPAAFGKQQFTPGHNLITHCTVQLPFLANGAAIYGGESNMIKACSFTDITQGSAILISTTFPTENKAKGINNNFSGTTVIESCSIKTSGGFDHEWDWRAAIEICTDKREIAGLEISDIVIDRSLSNGLSVIAKNVNEHIGYLRNATVENVYISNEGLVTKDKAGLFISPDAHGSLTIKKSKIPGIPKNSRNFIINLPEQ